MKFQRLKNTLKNRVLIYLSITVAYLFFLLVYQTTPIEEVHQCKENCCVGKDIIIIHKEEAIHVFFPFID